MNGPYVIAWAWRIKPKPVELLTSRARAVHIAMTFLSTQENQKHEPSLETSYDNSSVGFGFTCDCRCLVDKCEKKTPGYLKHNLGVNSLNCRNDCQEVALGWHYEDGEVCWFILSAVRFRCRNQWAWTNDLLLNSCHPVKIHVAHDYAAGNFCHSFATIHELTFVSGICYIALCHISFPPF